jgi:hypothetical protein
MTRKEGRTKKALSADSCAVKWVLTKTGRYYEKVKLLYHENVLAFVSLLLSRKRKSVTFFRKCYKGVE